MAQVQKTIKFQGQDIDLLFEDFAKRVHGYKDIIPDPDNPGSTMSNPQSVLEFLVKVVLWDPIKEFDVNNHANNAHDTERDRRKDELEQVEVTVEEE